jgi:hypothetical protein
MMTPNVPPNQTIEVTLAARTREFLHGAAIPVVVTLRNTSVSGISVVHSSEADMPFVFIVEREKGERFELSRERYQQQTMPNPPPPREQEVAPLQAGSVIEYQVDLASITVAPLKPGRYKIIAVYPLRASFRSAPIEIQIRPPRARLLEVAPSGNRLNLGAVMVDTDIDSTPALYQRESESGNPALGVLRRRRPLSNPVSVAISTDAEGATEPRWVAWIEDGAVSFLHVWGEAQLFASEPVALADGVRLAPHGWTFDDESVIFLATNASDVWLITIQNREPRVKKYEVAGGIANPAMLRAGFFKTQDEPPARRWLLVWPDGNRLMGSILNPETTASSARELTAQAQPLVVLDVESVAREGAPIICALFSGAAADDTRLVRMRGGEETQTTSVPRLPGEEATEELAVLAASAPAVAARTQANRIFVWTQTAGWRRVHESSSNLSNLRLALVDHRPWAVWSEEADGLHYLRLL